MLRFVIIEDEAGRAVGFEASGHAGSSARGKNLSCAAASALIQTLIGGLSGELGLELELKKGKSGFLSCRIEGEPNPALQEQIELLLRVVRRGLDNIAEMDVTISSVVRTSRQRDVTRSKDYGT
jgi:uncharacterized protein YsxB (DUF464 family)